MIIFGGVLVIKLCVNFTAEKIVVKRLLKLFCCFSELLEKYFILSPEVPPIICR